MPKVYLDETTLKIVPKWSSKCEVCHSVDLVNCICPVVCDGKKHTFGCGELIVAMHYKADVLDNCKHCKQCKLHCKCLECAGCHKIFKQIWCNQCGSCKKCCKCLACGHCGKKVDPEQICKHTKCKHCQVICCRRPVPKFNPPKYPIFHEARFNQYKLNPLRRFLSAELEVVQVDYGCYVDTIVKEWGGGIVRDGSLSNPNGGFEINTAPANGDLWNLQITKICDELNKYNAKVDQSCGLHIHVDARDFTYFDLRKLIFLYEKVEPGLMALVHANRCTNMYCTPCGKLYANALRETHTASATKVALIAAMYGSDLHAWEMDMRANFTSRRNYIQAVRCAFIDDGFTGENLTAAVKAYVVANYGPPPMNIDGSSKHILPIKLEKYSDTVQTARRHTLNLHTWLYRKTVECRLHQGSVNAEEIINWGRLLGYVMEYANRHTERELRALPINNTEQSFQLLLDLTPRQMHDHLTKKLSAPKRVQAEPLTFQYEPEAIHLTPATDWLNLYTLPS